MSSVYVYLAIGLIFGMESIRAKNKSVFGFTLLLLTLVAFLLSGASQVEDINRHVIFEVQGTVLLLTLGLLSSLPSILILNWLGKRRRY